ncbi:MAG: hypothetical protein ABEH38_02810, partial [Flavobacteriales bacterium]
MKGLLPKYQRKLSGVLLFLALFAGIDGVFAQDDKAVILYGKVTEKPSGDELKGVNVQFIKDGSKGVSMTTSGNGEYEVDLKYGHNYIIKFQKSGYATKKLNINTKNVPKQDKKLGGFEMSVGMTLFKKVEGVDLSPLEDPVGKATFNKQRGAIDFRNSYTAKHKKKAERVQKEAVRKLERKKEKKEDYKDAMEEGKDAMNDGDYEDAIESFKNAKSIFPDREKPKKKLEKAKKLKKKNSKKKKYKELVSEADDLYDDEDYKKAKEKYNEALGVISGKEHPKKRIEKIEKKLKKRQKKEQYDKLISKADELYDKKDYKKAKK